MSNFLKKVKAKIFHVLKPADWYSEYEQSDESSENMKESNKIEQTEQSALIEKEKDSIAQPNELEKSLIQTNEQPLNIQFAPSQIRGMNEFSETAPAAAESESGKSQPIQTSAESIGKVKAMAKEFDERIRMNETLRDREERRTESANTPFVSSSAPAPPSLPFSASSTQPMPFISEQPSARLTDQLDEPAVRAEEEKIDSAGAYAEKPFHRHDEKAGLNKLEEQVLAGMFSVDIDDAADQMLRWLLLTPVDLVHPRPLSGDIPVFKMGECMVLNYDEKIQKAFNKLIVEGFSSAPVVNKHRRFMGFIDLHDIVWYTIQCFKDWRKLVSLVNDKPIEAMSETAVQSTLPSSSMPSTSADTQPLYTTMSTKQAMSAHHVQRAQIGQWNTFFEKEKFRSATVEDVLEVWPEHSSRQLHAVFSGFSLHTIVEMMARLDAQRIAVLDHKGKPTNVMTQSMMISLLSANIGRMGGIAQKPVELMLPFLDKKDAIAIKSNGLAIEAFNVMATQQINALAIVDDDGNMLDVISVRDLRVIGLKGEHIVRLSLPVSEFKKIAQKEFAAQTPCCPLAVTVNDTFESVLRLMNDGNIYQIYLVRDLSTARGGDPSPKIICKPERVITQCDVLRFLLWQLGEAPPLRDPLKMRERIAPRTWSESSKFPSLSSPASSSSSSSSSLSSSQIHSTSPLPSGKESSSGTVPLCE